MQAKAAPVPVGSLLLDSDEAKTGLVMFGISTTTTGLRPSRHPALNATCSNVAIENASW